MILLQILHCDSKKPDPWNFLLLLHENCFNIKQFGTVYTQASYDVIRLKYYKTYITLSQQHWNWNALCSYYNLHDYILISLSSKLICKQQTISGSTNYINCSKCCPLALTQAWSHFLHWSVALATMVSLQSAVTFTSRYFSSARTCALCCALLHGAVVAMETAQLNLYQAFQTQSIHN